LFFAEQVLLVEGPSETALINKLLDDGKLCLPQGVYVLDCLGKYNIHRFMSLLSALGVSHSVFHDDDDDQNEHQELNQLIADSKNADLTIKIQTIAKNLETALGITPAGSPHRKPQHILYWYATDQINESKLNDFCGLVQSCFTGEKEFAE
jgi:predicted ATP-dependent endonuclease of OLD family